MKKRIFFVVISIVILGGLIIAVAILADQNNQKAKRIDNLLAQNNELTEKVNSLSPLEQEKKDLEECEQNLQDVKSSLESDVYLKDQFIKNLAIRLPSATVVNEVASMLLSGYGSKEDFAYLFYVSGEATSAWNDTDVKKLNDIGDKIAAIKKVVVIK